MKDITWLDMLKLKGSWGTLATRTWTAPIPPNRC